MTNAKTHLLVTAICLVTLLSGCSSLIPYEDEFACNRPDNMGKCVGTEEAYQEIITGESVAPYAKPASEQGDDDEDVPEAQQGQKPKANSGYMNYLDANYRESAQLLNAGITPVTTSGDTLKVVLLPYKIEPKIMLSERTMYIIIEEPEFIMGDYLMPKKLPVATLFGE